ncbi:hypothetical protein MtrunA17_Chr6g0486161 [Medicago truncatula]|uniref:Uncharacterized protein n=1 Tax=Medicago truncatula TaxID=3880 RepID=A0A396HHY3_MEDTR|nr:hypothetical protein MtrunA17_Chr6g0486161 [Medicago truncatula]
MFDWDNKILGHWEKKKKKKKGLLKLTIIQKNRGIFFYEKRILDALFLYEGNLMPSYHE